jgi:hypothetical protein
MQAAADGGAFGAAREILRGNDALVVSAGRDDAKLNGFDNDAADITVTVNRPPSTGPNSGNNNAVEVIIERPIPTTFLKVISRQNSTVRARAVAGAVPELKPACVIALNPSASGAITISGTTDVNIPECSILAASDDPQALTFNGSVNVTAGGLGFGAATPPVGSVQNGQGTVSPDPVSAPGATDPYAKYYADLLQVEPDPNAYPKQSSKTLNISSGMTLQPGYYQGGIKMTGGNVKLAAGIYVVDGFDITGGILENEIDDGAHGVMIFNTGAKATDSIRVGGNVEVRLHGIYKQQTVSAVGLGGIPDQYENVLFFNSRFAVVSNGSTSDGDLSGNAYSIYDGIMYFPTVQLNYSGTSTQEGSFAMIIADTIKLAGTPMLGPDWVGAGRDSGLKQVSLLE